MSGRDAEMAACPSWSSIGALRTSTAGEHLAAAAQGSIFENLPWFENLAQTCTATAKRQILVGAGNGEHATVLALRRLSFARLESLSNFYTALYGPITTEAADSVRHAKGIAAALDAHGFGTLRLHPIAAERPFWAALTAELVQRGYWVDRYFAFWNWYFPAAGQSWAQYLEHRPSRLRHTIQRSRRRLERTPGYRLELSNADTDAARVAELVRDFHTVYAHSWKRPEPFPDFIPGLCAFAHRLGQLRLGVSYLDGKPVAAQIWLHESGTSSIFKLAYDERYARHGVGTALTAALFEQALDQDLAQEVDFLVGDESYKAEWMSCRRARRGLIVFAPRTLIGLTAAARHYGAQRIRSWLTTGNYRQAKL